MAPSRRRAADEDAVVEVGGVLGVIGEPDAAGGAAHFPGDLPGIRWRHESVASTSWGFDFAELQTITDATGTQMIVQPKVVDSGHHSRRLIRVTRRHRDRGRTEKIGSLDGR